MPVGLEQGAGGASRQWWAVAVVAEAAAQTLAVWGAGPHGQQVVVAGNVAVPGQVVGILRVARYHHTIGTLEDTDSWLWEREKKN